MKNSTVETQKANDSVYKFVTLTSGKTQYTFSIVTGRFNYVSVCKNGNPYGSIAKQFVSFDQAQEVYKSPIVKAMILIAQNLLQETRSVETVRAEVKTISNELNSMVKACAKRGAIAKMTLAERQATLAKMAELNNNKIVKLTAIIAATTNHN
jgi:hypothetical protein